VIFGELRRTTEERTFPRPSSRRPLTFSRSSARLTISQRRRKTLASPPMPKKTYAVSAVVTAAAAAAAAATTFEPDQ